MAQHPDAAVVTPRPSALPGWVPFVLVVAMALGVVKQLFGLGIQVFPPPGPGNGGADYIPLSLRLAQWAIWPDYTDVGPMVLVPAIGLLWFTVSRASWTPTPGWRTRRAGAILLGVCAGLAVLRAVGVLAWWGSADGVDRANLGYVSETGPLFVFNSGLLGQLWFAAVGGVLTWCLAVAQPEAGRGRPAPVQEIDQPAASAVPAVPAPAAASASGPHPLLTPQPPPPPSRVRDGAAPGEPPAGPVAAYPEALFRRPAR